MKSSYFLTCVLVLLIISCSSSVRYFLKSIENDTNSEATIGSEMITWEEGQKEAGGKIISAVRRALVYGGMKDSIINIQFREYNIVHGSEYPVFTFDQNVNYNLNESDTILYSSLSIKVLKAETQKIEYVILEGPRAPQMQQTSSK